MRAGEGVNDIIRFNFDRLRSRMDDPEELYRYIHPRTREVTETMCARVYHVNLVLRMTTGGGGDPSNVHLDRVRVVLDRRGIQRVELIDPEVPAGAPGYRVVITPD